MAVVALVIIVGAGAGTATWLLTRADRFSTRRPPDVARRGTFHETRRRRAASAAFEIAGRARAAETRRRLSPAELAKEPAVRGDRVLEEEIGVSRRTFLNRGIAALIGAALAGFGAASLGFLWPTGASGFGGKILAGNVKDIMNYIETNAAPFYVPAARGYLVQYPKRDLPAAKKVYSAVTYAGMEQGFVALYQRCPHLGCRVPFCQTSQWFECPCHGSKYNRVGEKKAGPAPRGMDRFAFTINGGQITIDTGDIELGPPIGTNTTGQQQEGPLCV